MGHSDLRYNPILNPMFNYNYNKYLFPRRLNKEFLYTNEEQTRKNYNDNNEYNMKQINNNDNYQEIQQNNMNTKSQNNMTIEQ